MQKLLGFLTTGLKYLIWREFHKNVALGANF